MTAVVGGGSAVAASRPGPPPFAYYGGKIGLAPKIVELLPPHRVYIEPYFGSGAVLFAKPPSRFEIVNDLDHAVVTFFRVLRERTEDLERVCALTPHARDEFDAAVLDGDAVTELDDLELARRFWVRVNQSFAKSAGKLTGWSITTARSQSVPGSILSRIGRFGAVAQRLSSVSIECCDGPGLVERLATPDTAVYVDPPYLHATRSMRKGRTAPSLDYRVDASSDEHHARLAEVLNATPAKVILSGYPSELYEDLYPGWHTIDVPVRVHSSNAVTHDRGERVERLWLNYTPNEGRLALGAHS